MHQSPMKSQLRNQNGTGNVTKIPRRTVMRYPEAIHREQTSTDTLIIIHYLHQEEQRRLLQTSAAKRLPETGLRPVVRGLLGEALRKMNCEMHCEMHCE